MAVIIFTERPLAVAADATAGFATLYIRFNKLQEITIRNLVWLLARGFWHGMAGYTLPAGDGTAQGLWVVLKEGYAGGANARMTFIGPLKVKADGFMMRVVGTIVVGDQLEFVGEYEV